MMNGRFLRNVLLKGVGLFLIFNFVWALLPIHPGQVSLYNVLWKGRVVNPSVTDEQTVHLRELNAKLRNDPRVASSVVRLGDGLTLAIKK